jgi:hypothetical protein
MNSRAAQWVVRRWKHQCNLKLEMWDLGCLELRKRKRKIQRSDRYDPD